MRPVGCDAQRAIDVRVIAATHRDLRARGRSRALPRRTSIYRLAVVRVDAAAAARAPRGHRRCSSREFLRERGLDAGAARGPSLDRADARTLAGQRARAAQRGRARAVARAGSRRGFADLRCGAPLAGGRALAVRTDLPYADAKAGGAGRVRAPLHRAIVLAREAATSRPRRARRGIDRKHLRTLLKKHGLWSGDEDA